MRDEPEEGVLPAPRPHQDRDDKPPLVVGIGASAGGLEALEQFLDCLAPRVGAALVVVQHLSPDFKSLMDQLLARHTSLPIECAQDGVQVQEDHIYLIPPRKDMRLVGGRLHLTEQSKHQRPPMPIDVFFRSLAEERGERAIALVLSGTGTDGSQGVKVVKDAGGVVMVQSKESAKFDGMPRAAVDTGAVDLVDSAGNLAKRLVSYIQSPDVSLDTPIPVGEKPLSDIFDVVRREKGLNLTHYKERTIHRRILRRMSILQIDNADQYRNLLINSASEIDHLFRDLMIGVTEFFRDADAFEQLATYLPQLIESLDGDQVRVWVAGCSSGEEVYSLAMLLHETFEGLGRTVNFKIFATDLNAHVLATASDGIYPVAIEDKLGRERANRFFDRTPEGLQVARLLRDRVVFAEHNLCKDPPFTRIHLATCRNVLIYFTPEVQNRVIACLHFSLVPAGMLFLGPSEALGPAREAFEEVHNKWRIFRKGRNSRLPITGTFEPANGRMTPVKRSRRRREPSRADDHVEVVGPALLSALAEAVVVIDANGALLHTFGDPARFLTMPMGRASFDLMRMLPSQARTPISTAIHRAKKVGTEAAAHEVTFGEGDAQFQCDVSVKAVMLDPESPDSEVLVVLFSDARKPTTTIQFDTARDDQAAVRIGQLEEELTYTKENLQSTIEELETTNEELQSTNEELLASNEELQSTNEELHSVNEELYTVNAEHHHKIEELTELSGDIENLLRSTGIGTIFLDNNLCIRKYTPQAADVVPILASDIGRPVAHLSVGFSDLDLAAAAKDVVDLGVPIERETLDQHSVARLVRLHPYETNGVRRGVVVTFIDTSNVKEAEESLAESEARFQHLVEEVDQVFWTMTPGARSFTYVSPRFEELWGLRVEDLYRDRNLWLKPVAAEDAALAEDLFVESVREGGYEARFRVVDASGAVRWIHAKAARVENERGVAEGIVGSARDITESEEQRLRLAALAMELEDQAQRDALTGLINRRGLESLLSRELARARRHGTPLAAIFLDADDFKKINDNIGHTSGDRVLQGIANRMNNVLRPADILARIGGDEFLVILPETRLPEAVHVAERIRLAIADHPITEGEKPIRISASLGVSVVPPSLLSLEEILNSTGAALSRSKRTGKDRVFVATDGGGNECQPAQAADEHFELEGMVIRPHVQRIRRIADGSVIGYEILSRGPEGPYQMPGDFFRLSHERSMLTRVDLECLRACVVGASRLRDQLTVHLNIFPATLVDTPTDRIVAMMNELERPGPFCLELSEQQFLGGPTYLADKVRELKKSGVQIALDDVGFGRSSLEALVVLEPDVVKFAREVVVGVDKDKQRRHGLARMTSAVKPLSTTIVAEGVETEAERRTLADLGIEYGQGYLWDRPVEIGAD